MKNTFSKQLTATLCHEVMTPLNCIINVSSILLLSGQEVLTICNRLAGHSGGNAAHRREEAQLRDKIAMQMKMTHTMRASSTFMRLMLCSQMSSAKHQMKQLTIQFAPLEQTLDDFLREFVQPYVSQANQKNLKLTLKVANEFPSNMMTDWQVYSEILFHILANAFKFGKAGTQIHIRVVYCPLVRFPKPAQNVHPSSIGSVKSNQGLSSNRSVPPEATTLGFLMTEVLDFGSGIEASQFDSLFKTFNSVTDTYFKTNGIGLGLSTAAVLTQSL